MRPMLSQNLVHSNAQKKMQNFHQDFVNEVSQAVAKNEWVIVGMKQNPVVAKARKYLNEKNIPFTYIEQGSYFGGWKMRLAVKLWSGWPTFPQVFHKGVLVGGYVDLVEYMKGQ